MPGAVAPVGRLSHEKGQRRAELEAMPVPVLNEMIERHRKILASPSLLKNLPDKGLLRNYRPRPVPLPLVIVTIFILKHTMVVLGDGAVREWKFLSVKL